MTETPMRHGGQILVAQLRLRGIARVFSVPGESFLAALDGLHDSGIANIVCRHEGGAAMMAEAHAKLTGTPGVLFVTRGPGATNAAAGLHVARQDSTPMVAFVGQVPRGHLGREAFQEVDMTAFFTPLVKWAAEVHDTARLPEYIARAFAVAVSGRPGPVVLSLPEDMLSAAVHTPDIPPAPAPALPDYEGFALAALARLLAAKHPLIVAGGPGWSVEAAADLARLAGHLDLPVAVSFRRQDYLDNRHPCYAGDLGVGMNPALGRRLAGSDAVLAIGTRLGETATAGYRLLDPARPHPGLIHVHPDPDELGRVHRPALALAAPSGPVLAALAAVAPTLPPHEGTPRAEARAAYEAWQRPPRPDPGDLDLAQVMLHLARTLPEEAVLTNGAGNYAAWAHRYFTYRGHGTQLAPTSGSMGYGLPAAIAAAIARPDRLAVCLAGDGCLQMTVNELSTAAQYGADLLVLVVNNGQYGTIRMHQERSYPARVSGTALFLPDIPALAAAYGGWGLTVRQTAGFAPALDQALARPGLRMIELVCDPQALSTGQTLDEARAQGAARSRA